MNGKARAALALAALLAAPTATADAKISERVNFGCLRLADAGDLAILRRNRDEDGQLALVRVGRCAQFKQGTKVVALERAVREDASFLRVRVTERDAIADLWFAEDEIGGSFPDVPTRDFEDAR